jgi:hypothetical protein
MNTEDYRTIARRIHDVARAPQANDSIQATADDIARMCSARRVVEGNEISAEDQALRLMQAVRDEWTEWRGPAGLRETYLALFVPRPEQMAFNGEANYRCAECKDSGWRYVRVGDRCGMDICTHGIAEVKGA